MRGRFGIIRNNNDILITYDDQLFWEVLSSHPMNEHDIKGLILDGDKIGYLAIQDCCIILGLLGLDNEYDK